MTPIAKKPPPPSSETVRLNGCSRFEKLNFTDAGFASNGRLNAAPSDDIGQREDADVDRRQRQRIGRADAARRDGQPRRIGKPVAGNELAQLVDEFQRAAEAHRLVAVAQLHGDVGLLPVLRDERQLVRTTG